MILALGAERGVLSEVLSLWSVWDRRANTVSDNQLGCRSPGACLHVMSTPLASMALVLWESRQHRGLSGQQKRSHQRPLQTDWEGQCHIPGLVLPSE